MEGRAIEAYGQGHDRGHLHVELVKIFCHVSTDSLGGPLFHMLIVACLPLVSKP